jgi:hypothetical protein
VSPASASSELRQARDSLSATQVLAAGGKPLTGVERFARTGGAGAVCAILADTTLSCWGNLTWIVNQGTVLASPFAQTITADGDVPLEGVDNAGISYGGACAIVSGEPNKAYCWGAENTSRYPQEELGFDAPSAVALSASGQYGNHTVCLVDEGRVRCWGAGFGAAPQLVTKADESPMEGVLDLLGAYANFCALRDTEAAWCWGAAAGAPAEKYGVSAVTQIGAVNDDYANHVFSPRLLSSDGTYFVGGQATAVDCGEL